MEIKYISQYTPANYNSLNESTGRHLCDDNREHLARIGDIFWNHGVNQDLAVVFLHKHFEIDAEERLVENILENEIVIRPSLSDCGLTPYSWRLARNSKVLTWSPVEFTKINRWSTRALVQAGRFELAHAFQKDFGQYLINEGLEQVFGVMSRHREALFDRCAVPFAQIVEQTCRRTRTLTLTVESVPETRSDLIETVWNFDERGADGRVLVGCRNSCNYNGGHH